MRWIVIREHEGNIRKQWVDIDRGILVTLQENGEVYYRNAPFNVALSPAVADLLARTMDDLAMSIAMPYGATVPGIREMDPLTKEAYSL